MVKIQFGFTESIPMRITKSPTDLTKISFFDNEYFAEYKAFSNAISNADITSLVALNLEEMLEDGEYTHNVYGMKYLWDNKNGNLTLKRTLNPIAVEESGLIVSKEDLVRGALIAEAFLVYKWKNIHIVRPPQSGKTSLVWAVQFWMQKLSSILEQKSLYTIFGIQKALNALQGDLKEDLNTINLSKNFAHVTHLLGYKDVLKFMEDGFKECGGNKKNTNFLIALDEIQVAININGNLNKLQDETNFEINDAEKLAEQEGVFVLSISATSTTQNRNILSKLETGRKPTILQASCPPNESHYGQRQMLAENRIEHLSINDISFSSKKRKYEFSSKILNIYKEWFTNETPSIFVQRVKSYPKVQPFLSELLRTLTDFDNENFVDVKHIAGTRIVLLSSHAPKFPDFDATKEEHWMLSEKIVNQGDIIFKYYHLPLSARDQIFNREPQSKIIVLAIMGFSVGERIKVKKHVQNWVEITENPEQLMQFTGRMSGYPVGDNYFTGKIYCNLVPTDKYKLPMTEFFSFYDNIQIDGVSAMYPNSGYVPESCEQERRAWELNVTTNPLEINIYDVVRGVIRNDIGAYRNKNKLNNLGQTIETPQSVIDQITERVMENVEVVNPTDYRFKKRILETINGEKVDQTLEGKRRFSSKINADGYNIFTQSGLMSFIGREELQGDVSPSVGQYVNKMVGVITGSSEILDKYGNRLECDKSYIEAINEWLKGKKLPPVSKENPLYIDFKRCSYTYIGSTRKEKPSVYMDTFTE